MDAELRSFLTTTLDEGKRSSSCSDCFTLKERYPVFILQEAEWVSQGVTRFGKHKSLVPARKRTTTPQSSSPQSGY